MKVQLPWYGKAAGSSAGTIYQSYWGHTYTRSFPFIFHYPDTQKQQKTQASFFAIQRAWWAIYPQIAAFIPQSQRRNRNIYNALSKSLYNSILTYKDKKETNVRKNFGLDDRKQVKIFLDLQSVQYDGSKYGIWITLKDIVSTRKFSPKWCHYLLYNITQQEFFYQYAEYDSPDLSATFKLLTDWDRYDLVVCYLALSDENFFTNFYLCGQ